MRANRMKGKQGKKKGNTDYGRNKNWSKPNQTNDYMKCLTT